VSWERLGIDDIITVVQQHRLRWYGHVLRKEKNHWVRKWWSMKWKVMGWCCRKRLSICYTQQTSNEDAMDYRKWRKLIIAALHSRCGHYIFILWFLLSFFFFFCFLAWSQQSEIGCLPYFHTWCGLSAHLQCRSETCCTRLAENTGRKKVAKNRHLGTIAQFCQAISSQLRHVSTIGKKTC